MQIQLRSVGFASIALSLGLAACSGGTSSGPAAIPAPAAPLSPAQSAHVLDIGKLFTTSSAGRTVNAVGDKALLARLAAPSTSSERFALLATNVFTQSSTNSYTSTGSTCLPAGAAYVPPTGKPFFMMPPQIGIYDPATGDLKLNIAGSGTFVPASNGGGALGQPTTSTPAQICFKDTDVVPALTLVGGTTYTVLMYQAAYTGLVPESGNVATSSFFGGPTRGSKTRNIGIGFGFANPNEARTFFPGSNTPDIADYAGLSDRFFAPGVTLGKFTDSSQFAADILADNVSPGKPIANSYNAFGSPRIELRLVSPDGQTNVVAGIDSSQCSGNPANADGSVTFSAAKCLIVTSNPADTTALTATQFYNEYKTFKFAKPPRGLSPVQLVVDPYKTNNANPNPNATPPPNDSYHFLRVSLGL
ncbi:MAG: hypothetical protein M3N13_02285 [Candidatus Eremiobacteraeota bacterium]|nr:hypothetical protein [Candidatus Eremiobacteraeota bacterium]